MVNELFKNIKERMIKSVEEIQLIKTGAQIADIGGRACVEAIAENVQENEVALYSTQAS